MGYLEQILAQNAQRSQRTTRRKASIQDLLTAVQAPPAQAATPAGGASPMLAPTGNATGNGEADELWNRLQRMIKDAPGKIGTGSRSRSYAEQVRLYNRYKSGKGAQAAKPGTSPHGNGRANDLKYENDAVRAWALQNAGKYGLSFPLYNPKLGRGRDEAWHAQLKK